MHLQGKKALITGATGGIGEAIARDLHAHGAIVGLHGTREAKLKELAVELKDRAHVLPANLADTTEVMQLIKKAEEVLGGIDILVCNAGITKDGLLLRMSEQDFMEVLNVNLLSIFTLVKTAMRGMMKQRGGRIINIGSVVGTSGNPGQANYVASKAGLVGFTKSVAQEVASRNITVNCVAPGFISTAMTEKLTEEQKNTMLSHIPLGVFGEASDVAAAVTFLAGEGARYITGQTIHVNGGMVMV